MTKPEIPSVPQSAPGVNTPDLEIQDGEPVVRRKAVTSDEQAWDAYYGLKNGQDTRNEINAKIAKRYTGQRPRDPKTLREEGRNWQSNFPTGMLSGIIDRIVPNFLNAVEQQQYLTQATLPEQIGGKDVVDRDTKIETFREEITNAIRSWKEWRGFNAALITELVLMGYDFTAYTDEDTPWPILFRQDQAWIYEGSPQYSEYLQTFACEQPVLIHQFVQKIQNPKAADAGWRLDNCVDALNNTMPLDPNRDYKTNPRTLVDIIRESSTAQSFTSQAKGVKFGHLFIVEPEKIPGKGNITHYIMDVFTKKVLFSRERRFDSMADVVTLFTLEPGNNKFYGSRGVGRMLVNLSIGVDELVNDAVSQMKMSGLMILKTDSKTGINTQVKIRHPFAVINADGDLQKEQFPTDIEGFTALYEQLTKIAEVAVGAYIPNVLASDPSAGRRTAREASIDYSRELQSSSAYIARFVGQYQGEALHKIQKRLCKKDSTDPEAKTFRKKLIEKGLSEQEIDLLADSPAIANITDLTGQERQAKVALATSLVGNPMIDQKKNLEMLMVNQANPDVMKELMLEDSVDQSIQAEAIRLQLMELKAMEGGEPMPVSPRDAHDLHLKTLIPALKTPLQGLLQAIQQDPGQINPADLDGLHLCETHGLAHLQALQASKVPPDTLQVPEAFFKWMEKVLVQAGQAAQDAAIQARAALQGQHNIALGDELGIGQPLPDGVTPDMAQGAPNMPPHRIKIATSIDYKAAPDHIKRQIERDAGYDTTGLPDEPTPTAQNPNPPASPTPEAAPPQAVA